MKINPKFVGTRDVCESTGWRSIPKKKHGISRLFPNNMGFPGFSPKKTWDFHGFPRRFQKQKKPRKAPTAPPRCLLVTRKALRGDRDGIYRDGGDGGNGPDGDGNDEDMVGLWLMQTRCDDHHALNMYIYIYTYDLRYMHMILVGG